jgi:hypothetical protein
MTMDVNTITEEAAASRAQIYKLAWAYMQEALYEDRSGMLAVFRDMIPVVLIPDVSHAVTVDTDVNLRQGHDPAFALQDMLKFHAHFLRPRLELPVLE